MRIVLLLIPMLLLGCQSAYRIDQKSLPKQITNSQDIKLVSSDATVYSLPDIYKNHAATVVFFWQIGCPCVKRYQQRINHIYERFKQENVAFIYISSNTAESFVEVKKEYQKRGITLPLMRDEGGVLAKALAARGTPTAAIINPQGQVVFLGWIDNERQENEPNRIPYLETALSEWLNQQAISANTSPMFGCPIN